MTILRRRTLAIGFAVLLLPAAVQAATLTVDAATDPGTVGNGVLSLSEAIRLATGDLQLGALSSSELAQVSGTPGAASADTIVFDVAGPIALTGDGGGELLPPLDTGNDTIDGAGTVTLDAAGANPSVVYVGLHVSSSGNTVQGLTFTDVPGTALLILPAAGATITNNVLRSNHVVRPGIDGIRVVAALAAGTSITGGLVQGTVIQDNTIETGTPDNSVRGFGTGGMNFIAAFVSMPGGSITGASIRDTTLSGNTIQDVYQGVFIRAAVGFGPLSGNDITGFTIEDNAFRRVTDSSLLFVAGSSTGPGVATDNTLRSVTIRRNEFSGRAASSDPNQGGAIFLLSGVLDSCFDTSGAPTTTRASASGIEISDNTVSDRGPYAFFVMAAQSCGGAGGSLTDSVMEDVQITGNTIARCKTGVALQGTSTVDTGDALTNSSNVLRNVTVSGNTISDIEIAGIEFIAGFSGNTHGRAGATSHNTITNVAITGNTVANAANGIVVNGAIAQGPVAEQTGNSVEGVSVSGNTVSGSTFAAILVQAAIAATGSHLVDNQVDGTAITDNTLQSNRGIGIYVHPGAGDGRAEGNAVTGTQIARNTIRDTTMGSGANTRAVAVWLAGLAGNTLGPVLVDANTIERVDRVGISAVGTVGHTISHNRVSLFGKKPFTGNKRRNKLIANVFGPRARRRK